MRWPQGMVNLKESSQAPPGSSDKKLVFCTRLAGAYTATQDMRHDCTQASSSHTWPGQQHQELQRESLSASALAHQELQQWDQWPHHCRNVMISTMHLEGKEEKFSRSLWFKQQAGQKWQRASVITSLAIYEATTCKCLYIPCIEGNWCCTAVNIGGLIAPSSVFIVKGWKEEPLQITSKGRLRSAGLGSLILSRF